MSETLKEVSTEQECSTTQATNLLIVGNEVFEKPKLLKSLLAGFEAVFFQNETKHFDNQQMSAYHESWRFMVSLVEVE